MVSSEKVINQRIILDELNSIGGNFINLYSFTDEIIDIVLKEDAIFIRAFSEYQTGRWMLSLEEFKKINSVEELVKKTALPLVDQKGNIIFPNKLALVRVSIRNNYTKKCCKTTRLGRARTSARMSNTIGN